MADICLTYPFFRHFLQHNTTLNQFVSSQSNREQMNQIYETSPWLSFPFSPAVKSTTLNAQDSSDRQSCLFSEPGFVGHGPTTPVRGARRFLTITTSCECHHHRDHVTKSSFFSGWWRKPCA